MISETTPFPLPALARSLTALPGVGPKTAQILAARGLRTWGDALFFLPLRYEDRRTVCPVAALQAGSLAVVRGRVVTSGLWGRRGKVWRMVLADDTGRLSLLWFHFKKAQLEGFATGDEVYAVGQAEADDGGGWRMAHPEVIPAADAPGGRCGVGSIVPVYPEPAGLRQGSARRFMADLVARTVDQLADPLVGLLPAELYPFGVGQALRRAHGPEADVDLAELEPAGSQWRRVLAINELLHYELALTLLRRQGQQDAAKALDPPGRLLERFLRALPFRLTAGQNQALADILADMARTRPMARLLAGDVGSGKTVVAAAAAVAAAEAGVQTAMMAPTEVLARQHHASLAALLAPLGLEVALVLGGADANGRRQAQAAAGGGANLVVGTHALLAAGLDFAGLGLAIIDEQQRFGVRQRLDLAGKGARPHLLVLSATPIPRTMALVMGGHLDISDLPELPAGRPKVATKVLDFGQRRLAVEAMAQALAAGDQVYVICPLVEPSEKAVAHDAVETHRRLSQYFPDHGVGLLHGRMDGQAQQDVLARFRAGELRALVSTTVVEVGLDVPAATLMIVLGAERFGLSQLHQLRGRVGRGAKPGLCCLVAGPEIGETGARRLEVLASTDDGLAIAEADLALRGPGEALGAKQAGLPPLRLVAWPEDARYIPAIRQAIAGWLATDPEPNAAVAAVKAEAVRRWGRLLGLVEAG